MICFKPEKSLPFAGYCCWFSSGFPAPGALVVLSDTNLPFALPLTVALAISRHKMHIVRKTRELSSQIKWPSLRFPGDCLPARLAHQEPPGAPNDR
jgi:hypothetical protein